MDDESFLRQFEACTWPLEQWHHRQHVKVVYLYLRRYPLEEAVERLRESIKRFNAASADEFFEQHPELWQMKVLRLFYSRERLMSGEAKAKFVTPDISELPVAKKA